MSAKIINLDSRRPGYLARVDFDSDDPEFARGLEFGRLWQIFYAVKYWGRTINDADGLFHRSNLVMIQRVVDAVGTIDLIVDDVEDDAWVHVTFIPKGAPKRPGRRNPTSPPPSHPAK